MLFLSISTYSNRPAIVIYGWILMFEVSKNASFQNESFCIKHFFDWKSISGLKRRPPIWSPIEGQKPNFVIYGWILMFEVSKNASFKNESFCIKHFFDWRSISGLKRRSELYQGICEYNRTSNQRPPLEAANWPPIEKMFYTKRFVLKRRVFWHLKH